VFDKVHRKYNKTSLLNVRLDLHPESTILLDANGTPHMTRKQVSSRLNALDRDMGRAMLHAENQLRIPPRK
jgi:hypothetical protein